MSDGQHEMIHFDFPLDEEGIKAFRGEVKPFNFITGIEELNTVIRLLHDNFKIVDWEGIYIIFAVAVALYVPGEMLWLRVIGPSRSGKTEILRAIAQHRDSRQMEMLTPAAIRGGLKEQKSKLLPDLNNKRVVTLDMAALLTTRADFRNEVFGLLRLVKDGRIDSDFGSTEGHLEQETKFDWILATTPHIEQYRQLESLLGERFIDLWWRPAERVEVAIQATENNPKLAEIRKELAEAVSKMLDAAKQRGENLGEERIDNQWIGKIADVTALLRSPVEKDRQGNISSVPQPEYGTDIAQSFQKVALGLTLLGVDDYKPYIKRLSRDCCPSIRKAILGALVDGRRSIDNIASETLLPASTVRYHLQDLEALGVIVKIGNTYTYKLAAKLENKIRSIWI